MYSEVELKVKVEKNELIKVLTENRQKHSHNYDKAKIGFRKLLIAELKSKLEAAESDKIVTLTFENHKPESHLEDYDDILGMLELATDTEIELSHIQYKQYVKDEWDWARQWSTSNATYLSAAL